MTIKLRDYTNESYPHLSMASAYQLPYGTVLLLADALPKTAIGKTPASGLNPHEVAAMLSVEKLPGRDNLFAAIETVYRRYHP